MQASKSTPTSKEVVSKYAGFTDFIRNATEQDKEIVFTAVLHTVNAQQRAVIQKAEQLK